MSEGLDPPAHRTTSYPPPERVRVTRATRVVERACTFTIAEEVCSHTRVTEERRKGGTGVLFPRRSKTFESPFCEDP